MVGYSGHVVAKASLSWLFIRKMHHINAQPWQSSGVSICLPVRSVILYMYVCTSYGVRKYYHTYYHTYAPFQIAHFSGIDEVQACSALVLEGVLVLGMH